MNEHDWFQNARNKLPPIRKVCAQCKHFYTRIDKGDGISSGLAEYVLNASPDDVRNAEEIRLCYEIHWCSAASPVCDDDFEPLTIANDPRVNDEVDMLLEQYSVDDLLEQESRVEWVDEFMNSCTPVHHYNECGCKFDYVPEPMEPQKEIQYVYIGLLQENPDATHKQDRLVEVPTEIDGVATGYRRVEMCSLDWDLFYTYTNGTISNIPNNLSPPNTARNAVDIDFPVSQTDWCGLSHFGMYDLPVGGRLICTSEFMVRMDILADNCAAIDAGYAEIPLKLLTDNHNDDEKKGGE